ncbi:MAG: pyridoxal-phosphate dependent enzyme, partial [Acidobacteria bacterium]|nr:pyridoxal-phosphate dependent enzyme [Acidobacteriota bacterium]
MITIDAVRTAARRLEGRILRTPLRRSEWLSALTYGDVFLKLETLQPTFSFKIRGALNAVLAITEQADRPSALVTASAGNHGQALAYAARAAGLPLTVFV